MSLVLLQFIRQPVLIAQAPVVEPTETCQPVAMLGFTITLQVILTTGKVPHEVAPVHEVTLVGDEETQVFELRRNLDGYHLTTAVILLLMTIDTTHPAFVLGTVGRAVHTWEQHVLGIFVLVLGTENEVFVLLVRRGLLLTLPDWIARGHHRLTIVAFLFQSNLRGVCLSVEQRTLAVLFTTQIFTQREDILWRVLVHRWIG